jgi:hypothetical protein
MPNTSIRIHQIAGVTQVGAFHDLSQRVAVPRRFNNQKDVVGHLDIMIQSIGKFFLCIWLRFQDIQMVAFFTKNALTIIASGQDMIDIFVWYSSWWFWHIKTTVDNGIFCN